MVNKKLLTLAIIAHSYACYGFNWQQEINFDWSDIKQASSEQCWSSLSLAPWPEGFMWGAATSGFQIEGTQSANESHCQNSWTIHANCTEKRCFVSKKRVHKPLAQPGIACDHWNRFKEDVQLIKQAGLNSYRLSVPWEKIEPDKHVFDQAAMQHYIDLINELVANGIKPIVCLFHHTWPVWFDKLGAFEKKKNIKYFVEFAQYVFEKLHTKVPMWMTFNEPVGYALEGYFRGHYPPFKKSLPLCGTVVCNMLNAHVQVYHLFKKIDNNVKVGFPKVFNPLDPYSPYNPFDQLVCKTFNYLLHDSALNFFKTGKFDWLYTVTDNNPQAIGALDFLGINYYTHTVIKNFGNTMRPSQQIVGGRALYPEGLYRSIKKAAELADCPAFKEKGITFHIAENGINDPDDRYKDQFFIQHLLVVQEALKEGIAIDGYFVWTLMDSFSWKKNTDSKMGLYYVDPVTKNRTLYAGAQPLVNFLLQCH